MSASEIIAELPKLNSVERLAVQKKLAGIVTENPSVELHDRGIDETQAADLRSRLKTFTEDWERPEAAIYDETPAR
jgi:hypothetical protein